MTALRAQLQRRQPTGANLVAVPDLLAVLARRQRGVVTRGQLRAHGMSDAQIVAALDAHRWRGFGRYVVVLHNAALTDQQRLWAAVLLPGKPCALAGASAAALAGLRGFEPDQVHIVLRHATHVRAPAWVKLHESRRFSAGDIRTANAVPHTRTTRSVVDAATWTGPPRRACAILCAAVQQRLVTPSALLAELQHAGRVRHVAVMRNILGDISGGGHTLPEIDLAGLARRAGLGQPRRQALRHEPSGRIRYIDAEFDLPDGTVLAVEVDGSGHLDPATWADDLDRQNELTIGGRPTLRFPSVTIRTNGAAVVDQLRRARLAHIPR